MRVKLMALLREARHGTESIDRLLMQPDSRRVMAERLARRFQQLVEDALPHELSEAEEALATRPLTLLERLHLSLREQQDKKASAGR